MVTPRLAAYGVGVLAVLAVLAGIYAKGYTTGKSHIQTLWDADKAAQAQLVAKVVAKNLRIESESRQAVAVATTTAREGIKHVEDQYSGTVRDLNNGTLKLREGFNACARTLSRTATDSGKPVVADEAGLAIESAKRIVRAAADGDRAIIERNQCVAILIGERAQNGDSH